MTIATYSTNDLIKMQSATNWDDVDALSDEQITNAALTDDDNQPLTDEIIRQMRPCTRAHSQNILVKGNINIRLNHEILDFFQSQGKGWESKINDILQHYVDAHHAA